jgi:hypothetical protein
LISTVAVFRSNPAALASFPEFEVGAVLFLLWQEDLLNAGIDRRRETRQKGNCDSPT